MSQEFSFEWEIIVFKTDLNVIYECRSLKLDIFKTHQMNEMDSEIDVSEIQ